MPIESAESGASNRSAGLKVLHAVRQYPPALGGLEAVVSSLAERQASAGHDVRVVTLNRIFDSDGPPLASTEWRNGVEIVRVGFRGPRRYPFAPGVLGALGDADLVHVHGVEFMADFLGWLRPLHGKPLILSTHGGFFHTPFARRLKRVWFNTITRATLHNFDFVAASSEQDAASFRRVAGAKVVAVENAVDTDKFAGMARPGTKTMLYFGRLAPNKGLDRLLAWFAALLKRDGEWRLIIAGKAMGVSMEQLRRIVARHQIDHAVEFHEAPSDEALGRLVSRSTVFSCASTFEGFGLAAVEAIGAGLFPLLSDIPPFQRTLERVSYGMAIPFEPQQDVDRFLAELDRFEVDLAAGNVPAPDLSPFGWQRMIDQTYELYFEAVQPPRGRAGSRPAAFDRQHLTSWRLHHDDLNPGEPT